MPVEHKLPAKIGMCWKNLGDHNFDYKQFLPGLEEPEESADAEKLEILR